jgi:hypothetical protein
MSDGVKSKKAGRTIKLELQDVRRHDSSQFHARLAEPAIASEP